MRARQYYAAITVLNLALFAGSVLTEVNARPSIDLSVDQTTVGDSVAYSPNLDDGGFAIPTHKSRFNERAARLVFNENAVTISAGIAERQFTSLRDNFEFLEHEIGFRYRLDQTFHKNTHVWLNYSSNKSSQLLKNSYTTVGEQVIKSVVVSAPADKQLQLGIEQSTALDSRTMISFFGLIGKTDTKHAGLKGNLARGNCDYQFEFNNQGGSVEQINQCGNVTALTRSYPNDDTVEQEFGVSPALDLRNKSKYVRIGTGINRAHKDWLFSASYYYQRYVRDQLDHRIQTAGGSAHRTNHVITGNAGYQLSKELTLSARAEYQRHRYLDEIPVLYTTLTSDRFNKSAVFFSVNINYRFSL